MCRFTPASGLLRALLRIHGLPDTCLPLESNQIPPSLVHSLELEAVAILEGTSPISTYNERRDFVSAFAIVGKCFPVPCFAAAKAQLALNLQQAEDREEIDTITFESILAVEPASPSHPPISPQGTMPTLPSVPPFDMPPTLPIPFATLKISKSEVASLMSTPTQAPSILFEANTYPKNEQGFPTCDFSQRLKIGRHQLIDPGIPNRMMTSACAVVSSYNRMLNNDRIDALIGKISYHFYKNMIVWCDNAPI